MKRNSLVSIIVPVHNTALYLQKCLESIVRQTYRNIEIILVDDGSTDESPQICDFYANSDPRIIVLHQPNSGAVGARKAGIERSCGDYIMFVDSDDWMSPEMCNKLVCKAECSNADVTICDFANVQAGIVKRKYCGNIYSPELLLHKIILYQHPSVLWNKLFKRELAIKSLMNCVVGDDISEDFLANVSCLLSSPTIAYVPELLYYQNRDVQNSMTTNLPTLGKALYVGRNNLERVHKLLIESGVFAQYKYDFNRLVLNVKTYLLAESKFKEARCFYPESHKEITTFNVIARPANWIYYGALNWGICGIALYKIYHFVKC